LEGELRGDWIEPAKQIPLPSPGLFYSGVARPQSWWCLAAPR